MTLALWIGSMLLIGIIDAQDLETAAELIESKPKTLCQDLRRIDRNFKIAYNSRTEAICRSIK